MFAGKSVVICGYGEVGIKFYWSTNNKITLLTALLLCDMAYNLVIGIDLDLV